ncbi:MAG: hypothetical protein Q9167_004946 [Letrouitia subvulpina]
MRLNKVRETSTNTETAVDEITAAFQDFLTSYKSTENALEDLNIDGDNTSDEYDFMDDVAGRKDGQQSGQSGEIRTKYMDILQQVADRKVSEILIELDDLDNYEKSFGDDVGLRLVESVERNAKHYIEVLSQAVDKVMPKETKEIT